jgi:membrane fusion protein, multidrug efflux system
MKTRVYLIVAALILIAGCNNQEERLQADVEIPVGVIDITLKPIEEVISTTGTVYPRGVIELRSRISATYILEKNPRTGKTWQMGDRVQAGDVIVRFEDREFINSVRLEAQELSLELAESELQKQQSLFEKGGVTLRELKNASVSFINAKYALESARLQMEKMKIISTIDGVIVDLPYFTPRTLVESNAVVVKIMDYKTMYMDIKIPEKYLTRIVPSQPARLTNYTITNDTIAAFVSQTSPAIDSESRTFKGVISADNKDFVLRPGMFVKADIVVNRKDTVIVIPKDIILSRQNGKIVYVVVQGRAVERMVVTGLETTTEVEILRGLAKDERLITSGYETLSRNARVKILR